MAGESDHGVPPHRLPPQLTLRDDLCPGQSSLLAPWLLGRPVRPPPPAWCFLLRREQCTGLWAHPDYGTLNVTPEPRDLAREDGPV